MPSRFVAPDTTTLKISHGDTLLVKRRLNTGEHRDAMAKMSRETHDGERLRANPFEVGITTVLAYLVDWSLTDEDGALVEIRGLARDEVRVILDQLDPDDFEEIKEAIDQHVAVQTAAREAEKNGQGGATGSPAISPSLVGATGATSGSPS
jgi:hypothetical protein